MRGDPGPPPPTPPGGSRLDLRRVALTLYLVYLGGVLLLSLQVIAPMVARLTGGALPVVRVLLLLLVGGLGARRLWTLARAGQPLRDLGQALTDRPYRPRRRAGGPGPESFPEGQAPRAPADHPGPIEPS